MNKLTALRTQWTNREQGFAQFVLSWVRSRNDTLDVQLKDGSTAHIRPITADDTDLIVQILDGLSADSRYMRFNTSLSNIADSFLHQLARQTVHSITSRQGKGFIVVRKEADGSETPMGKARFVYTDDDSAEIALSIADEFQGLGLGTILVKQLVNAAQNDGLARLEAVVNRNNRPMQRLIHKLGLPTDEDYDSTSVIMTVFLNGGAYGWSI